MASLKHSTNRVLCLLQYSANVQNWKDDFFKTRWSHYAVLCYNIAIWSKFDFRPTEIPTRIIWTHEILTHTKIWTRKIPARKKFKPTKYSREEILNPQRHDDTMARDSWNLAHSFFKDFGNVSNVLRIGYLSAKTRVSDEIIIMKRQLKVFRAKWRFLFGVQKQPLEVLYKKLFLKISQY